MYYSTLITRLPEAEVCTLAGQETLPVSDQSRGYLFHLFENNEVTWIPCLGNDV